MHSPAHGLSVFDHTKQDDASVGIKEHEQKHGHDNEEASEHGHEDGEHQHFQR